MEHVGKQSKKQSKVKKMMCRVALALLVILTQQVSAQHSFSGVVTDVGQETLPGVQVLLFVNDSLYAGALTDDAGHFSLRNIQTGDYLLRILYPGFTPLEENRQIRGSQHFQFTLEKEMTVDLTEIEVVGNLSDVVKRTATGQIFRLSEKAKNSGDPYRALSEIPRLVVNDALRTISMQDGSTPLVLVNGMTVNSGVSPIDPKDIESVEVMDVVNARYLRTGATHIINIKLKEKRSPYRFFEVMNRHDVPRRQSIGALYFEIGNSRFSLYGRGAGDYIYHDNSEITGWQQGGGYYKQSSGATQTDSYNFLGELLFKGMLTPKDYLAAHIYGKYDRNKTTGNGNGSYQADSLLPFNYASLNKTNSYVWTGSLYLKHIFSDNEMLENTFAYNYNRNGNEGERNETYPDWLYNYLYEYRNKRSSGRWNADYSRSWNNVNSLNAGSELKFTDDHIQQVSENYPAFLHREWNLYLYAAFSSKIKNFYYMGSLGMESIWLKAGDISGNYVKPRGSVSGTYVFNDNHSLQAGYTLTNEAPAVGQLNPYNTSTDSLVITRGNPALFPMQAHDASVSYTFNKAGLYLTPYASYRICTDIIEPFGYSENDIYINSYHNNGKYRTLTTGSSLSYRIKDGISVFGAGYYYLDYFKGQDPQKSFSYYAGASARLKKWLFYAYYNYRNYTYTAISRTNYHTPDYSFAQIQYNFKPNFYVSVAVQYLTGALQQDVETYGDNYRSFISQRMTDKNIRPWILIRYTFRKNDQQKIKLNNIVTGKEQGISL